jgi:predicted deacetylase
MAERAVLLVLHDVAPSTWPDYRSFVEAVDALGTVPITWLVVPDFHHHDSLAGQDDFRRLLDDRVARGDELTLHGYYHCDDQPAPHTPRQWFMRRIYTHEGEFISCRGNRRYSALPTASTCSAATTGHCKAS